MEEIIEHNRLLSLLERIFGRAKALANEEYQFHCPNCHHHKKKLSVNVSTQKWQCWVCNVKGRTLFSLLKKFGASTNQLEELASLVGSYKPKVASIKKRELSVELPKEFIPLYEKNARSIEYRNAIRYLSRRGVTASDILKYGIGYCDEGSYSRMIIVPSYDSNGDLNFFTGRSYYGHAAMKHKNPPVTKDIVGFELFVAWESDITIVEGVFDAIAVKRNAIPLFGKVMQDSLKRKIIQQNVGRVNIALDRDAIRNSLNLAQELMSVGCDVRIIDLGGDKDPSDVGFERFHEILNDSVPLTFSDIVRIRMGV